MKLIRYICDKNGDPRMIRGMYDALFFNEKTNEFEIHRVSL